MIAFYNIIYLEMFSRYEHRLIDDMVAQAMKSEGILILTFSIQNFIYRRFYVGMQGINS